MRFTSIPRVTPLRVNGWHGVTRHQHHIIKGDKTAAKRSSFFQPNRCALESTIDTRYIIWAPSATMKYKGEVSYGAHCLKYIICPQTGKYHKAISFVNSNLKANEKVSLCPTRIYRMCKSSTIAQRAGHGSGYLSAWNPSNTDAPFGDPCIG